jgi:hypothetical protein
MPRFLRGLVLMLMFATFVAGCGTGSSGGGGGSSSVRCLDGSNRGGYGAHASSDSPDRPIFFLFCTQSP